jgi:hypothetical protein
MARRKILMVEPALLCGMLRGHDMEELRTDFPADAVIVGCGWDETRNYVRLAVESESFDEVPDGYFAPDLSVTITRRVSELDAILRLVTSGT